jgi:hypothetical protein
MPKISFCFSVGTIRVGITADLPQNKYGRSTNPKTLCAVPSAVETFMFCFTISNYKSSINFCAPEANIVMLHPESKSPFK